jgi:putative serine protease PepD
MALGDAQQGIAFAVPFSAVRDLAASKQSTSTPTIAAAVEEIWEQPPEFLAALDENVRGLVARVVKPGGPAAAAGIENGAIITSVDGRLIEYRDDFIRAIRRKKPGEAVKLVLADSRGRDPKEVSVRLASLEVPVTSP